MGPKNAKHVESESVREQKMMRAQRATLIQVCSCRVTNVLLLLLAQALHFLLQEALALLLLGVLGALLLVQLKTLHFASSCPPAAGARSGQPRISPCRWIPCPGPPDPGAASLHRPAGPAAQHYASKTSRQAGQRWTDRAAGRRSAERHFVVVFYYYHGSDPCRARGIRAREGVSRCPARRRG